MHSPTNRSRTGASPAQRPIATINSGGRPNTLNLQTRDLNSLLDTLDRHAEGERPSIKRGFVRWPFRHASIRMEIVQGSGARAAITVACRNLSRGGVFSACREPGVQVRFIGHSGIVVIIYTQPPYAVSVIAERGFERKLPLSGKLEIHRMWNL